MTIMGHIHRIRKGIIPSTKITIEQKMDDKTEQELPLELARGDLYIKHYIEVNQKQIDEIEGIILTNLPGCFPITSSRGNSYAFVNVRL